MVEIKESEYRDLPKSPFPAWLWFVLVGWFRERSIDRQRVIDQTGILPGWTVLEVGCGPGFFTESLAAKVGSSGKIIAQDVQRRMLEGLVKRAGRFAVKDNIEPLLADSARTGLPDASVDLVFAANVFEEIAKEGGLIATTREMYRVLKPAGRLYFGEHRVPAKMIESIYGAFKSAGFKCLEVEGSLFFSSAILIK